MWYKSSFLSIIALHVLYFIFYLFVVASFVDPVPSKAYILGDANSTQLVSLKQPATLRCLAGGQPKPFVSWWKGTDLLPYKSTRFEVTQDFSLVFHEIELADLGPYICQAYSGQGKPVSKYVTLKAVGPVHVSNDEDRQYLKYLIDAPVAPVTPSHIFPHLPYRPTPRIPVIYEDVQPPAVGKYLLSIYPLLLTTYYILTKKSNGQWNTL